MNRLDSPLETKLMKGNCTMMGRKIHFFFFFVFLSNAVPMSYQYHIHFINYNEMNARKKQEKGTNIEKE